MPFITKIKSPHKCYTPRLVNRFTGRYRFGEGTVWQCRKCNGGWKQIRGYWETTLIEQ